jgi:hypothetical protein
MAPVDRYRYNCIARAALGAATTKRPLLLCIMPPAPQHSTAVLCSVPRRVPGGPGRCRHPHRCMGG